MAPVLGSSSTALEALRGVDLTGKSAVVTGNRRRALYWGDNDEMSVKQRVYYRWQFWLGGRDSAGSGSRWCQGDHNKPELGCWSEGS